jgi:spore coat polysaccharide biosynthesis protein SpsF (cytidylyltransferase family)
MIEKPHFETFLYISVNKYRIFVQNKNDFKNIYNKEIEANNQIEFDNLSKFLDENIYKIEKNSK